LEAYEILTIRYYCHYKPTVIRPEKLNTKLNLSTFYMKQQYIMCSLRYISFHTTFQ